jgi:hypothetical protein
LLLSHGSILLRTAVDYEEPEQPFRYFHHVTIAEGILDHTFFNNQKRRPLLSLHPRQSLFRTSLPSVYIGPDFSYEKARPQLKS